MQIHTKYSTNINGYLNLLLDDILTEVFNELFAILLLYSLLLLTQILSPERSYIVL